MRLSLSSPLAASLSLLLLSLSSFALTGCSSGTTPQATGSSTAAASAASTSFCESYCTKWSTCDSHIDSETCNAKCEDGTSSSLKRIRPEIVSDAQACFESSDCRSVLSGKRLEECIDEAAVSVAPLQPVKDFCDGLIDALERCDVDLGRADCLATMKTYSDATLAEGSSCFPKSCKQMPDCVFAVLGIEK